MSLPIQRTVKNPRFSRVDHFLSPRTLDFEAWRAETVAPKKSSILTPDDKLSRKKPPTEIITKRPKTEIEKLARSKRDTSLYFANNKETTLSFLSSGAPKSSSLILTEKSLSKRTLKYCCCCRDLELLFFLFQPNRMMKRENYKIIFNRNAKSSFLKMNSKNYVENERKKSMNRSENRARFVGEHRSQHLQREIVFDLVHTQRFNRTNATTSCAFVRTIE